MEMSFPFIDSSPYAGFGKLKQELPGTAAADIVGSSSRPPWMLPPSFAPTSKPFADGQYSGNASGRFPDLNPAPFSLPFDNNQVLYKSSLMDYKDRGRHYPLQYNGGSLVLDQHRGELINLSRMTQQEIQDAKQLAASKSHSEAERRRRERINRHLATLRSLLPSTTKTDKASLLAEVIDHVKELKKQAAEIAEGGPVPTDVDEVKVDAECDTSGSSGGGVVMRASLCCDDRPNLLSDLTKTLKTLKLKTLKAEMATLGGRVKSVMVMTSIANTSKNNDGSGGGDGGGGDELGIERPSVSCVQEALRSVMERSSSSGNNSSNSNNNNNNNNINNSEMSSSNSSGKRQKLHHHSYS